MLLTIAGVLSPEDLERVGRKMASLTWRDGARTAGRRARKVKRNQQAVLGEGTGEGLHDFLREAVASHPVLRAAARPKQFSRLLISRTQADGGYGRHVDNALMGDLRTDLSFTLFLSDPDSYAGGALAVDTPSGVFTAKPPAGDLVLYPSGSIHEVEPVIAGERFACVGWIESQVRRADQREVLFELENVRAAMPADTEASLALDKAVSNLLRMWVET